jgi:hypothetical protein
MYALHPTWMGCGEYTCWNGWWLWGHSMKPIQICYNNKSLLELLKTIPIYISRPVPTCCIFHQPVTSWRILDHKNWAPSWKLLELYLTCVLLDWSNWWWINFFWECDDRCGMHQFQVLISPVAKSQPLALLHGMHHHYLTFCKIITTHTRGLFICPALCVSVL